MIPAVRELLSLLHVGRQHWSVAQCERDVERAKHDLALALDARDRAVAELRIAEPPPRKLPSFLLIENVTPINRAKRHTQREADLREVQTRG